MIRITALAILLASGAAFAQQQPVAPAAAPDVAETRLHQDWAWMARYRDENRALPPAAKHPRVVFLGDSITQGWRDKHPAFFTDERIGRGIGGQTSPQMLVRFRQDVIDLHPAVVQIMAGTNDIASNTGPMSIGESEANFRTMTELAQAHGIRVILASIPPADLFPWRPGLAVASRIVAINAWLKDYAARTGSTYADYWTALKGAGMGMRDGLSSDHVHPTSAGYDVMEPVARRAIAEALAKPAPTPLGIVR
jgi:lysophospholipase L1-like esterase